jgi:hypothetical protein
MFRELSESSADEVTGTVVGSSLSSPVESTDNLMAAIDCLSLRPSITGTPGTPQLSMVRPGRFADRRHCDQLATVGWIRRTTDARDI